MTELSTQNTQARLIALIQPVLEPLGYEVVYVEVQNHRQKVLRVFIDRLGSSSETAAVGIHDCVLATKALDEPLDLMPEVDAAFNKAPYELEVSSPGADRPLRAEKDFERFLGRQARIHTFRPLNVQEIGNPAYLSKNPKQKNFFGELRGTRQGKVLLALVPPPAEAGPKKKQKGKSSKGAEPDTNSVEEVLIPLPLISKANLEPAFDFGDDVQKEKSS